MRTRPISAMIRSSSRRSSLYSDAVSSGICHLLIRRHWRGETMLCFGPNRRADGGKEFQKFANPDGESEFGQACPAEAFKRFGKPRPLPHIRDQMGNGKLRREGAQFCNVVPR